MILQPSLFLETMNSQQKVTISGVVFHVEESCKKKLMDHIQLIQSRLFNISDELLAELLLEKLKDSHTDVVCAKMVEEVIQKAKQLKQPD